MSPSEEVLDNAEGSAPARSENGKSNTEQLEQRAAELRAVVEQPSVKEAAAAELANIEQQLSEQREAAGRTAATERLLGIRRAHGSMIATYGEDESRVQQAVAALGEAITTLNSRARKLDALRAEAAALADRFALTPPSLSVVSEPQLNLSASLPAPWRLRAQRPSFESDEYRLRERRDYTEVAGSVGFGIIERAGLKPFRELTASEREVLEEERKADHVLQQAATEAIALGQLRVPGGHVHSG